MAASQRTTKALIVAGTLVLAVLLYFAPRTHAAPEKKAGPAAEADATIEVFVKMASKTLAPASVKAIGDLEAKSDFDSVAQLWLTLKRPDVAAFYSEKAAAASDKPSKWFEAGNRYYTSVQFSKDESEIPALYQSAIRCFRKVIAAEPSNTDARIMLASCYVEGSSNPMEGINMLREIEKTDSANVKLQLAFATFSTRSGQLDKAVARFQKVLRIDSSYVVAYLHLADAYEQLGDNASAVKMLESYLARESDVTIRLKIREYIDQLKSK